MTDRNNAPAGRLVPEVRVPTEKELREQNHPERDGKPMLLSSKWMVKAGLAMCDELLAVCKQLVHDLDETDHEDVYLAMGCEKQDRVAAAGAADRGRTGGVTKAMKRTVTRAKVWDARQLPAYLTPAEYAALIGVCPKTVQRMCRMGMLPATKVGPKLWRIDKNAALEKMKKPAGAENTGGLRVKAI